MKIKRLGTGNYRVTVGQVYEVGLDGKIEDDNGRRMRPQRPVSVSKNDWWEVVEENIKNEPAIVIKGESKMLTIKNTVLVDGRESDELTVDKILSLIEKEESHLERLSKFKSKSKAIDNLVIRHTDNICKLIVIVDAREE